MSGSRCIEPQGENLRRAIRWISEITLAHPEKKRMGILRDAEIRFDLSPIECEFLNSQFCQEQKGKCN